MFKYSILLIVQLLIFVPLIIGSDVEAIRPLSGKILLNTACVFFLELIISLYNI